MPETTDPVDLTAALVRCQTVTPAEGGALHMLGEMLAAAGFRVHRADRNGTPNLVARWGNEGPVLGFNGHTDVVPTGDPSAWRHDPFGGQISQGRLWGRGSADMKSGVAAFVAAAIDFVAATPPQGSILITITGDEEGTGADGTLAILEWMRDNGDRMDHCLVGEPTCPTRMGEMMKIGRRGSATFRINAQGVQGHAAYPHRAKNPLHALTRYLSDLIAAPLDRGTAHFDPSGLQITSIDCGNPASNVIPATASAVVNIRFNDLHTGASLTGELTHRAQAISDETGVTLTVATDISGEAFLTQPGAFVDLVRGVVAGETGRMPELSTSGGTSDARFVKDHCPVVEFGLVGHFMHQVDERVPVAQIHQLKAIYQRILERFFA